MLWLVTIRTSQILTRRSLSFLLSFRGRFPPRPSLRIDGRGVFRLWSRFVTSSAHISQEARVVGMRRGSFWENHTLLLFPCRLLIPGKDQK